MLFLQEMEGARDYKGPPGLMVLMVILMRMQHLSPETKETSVNKANRERLEPKVFKDLFVLKENREPLQTMAQGINLCRQRKGRFCKL